MLFVTCGLVAKVGITPEYCDRVFYAQATAQSSLVGTQATYGIGRVVMRNRQSTLFFALRRFLYGGFMLFGGSERVIVYGYV